MAITGKLGKFGGRFAFEFFLQTIHGVIIEGLKRYLSTTQAEDITGMIQECRFPPIARLDLSAVGDNLSHLEKISLLRLMKFIAEARPDLAEAIQDQGQAGADYMAKLREYLLDGVRQPAKDSEFIPEKDTAIAHCDKCDNKWPVSKEELLELKVCPFCGDGAADKKETPPADEGKASSEAPEEEEE